MNAPSPAAAALAARLAALQPARLVVRDESARHKGHPEAKHGAHLKIEIAAACFAGKSPLARHRMIYDAAGELPDIGIHALSIAAQTPAEADLPPLQPSDQPPDNQQ